MAGRLVPAPSSPYPAGPKSLATSRRMVRIFSGRKVPAVPSKRTSLAVNSLAGRT